jgi:hypothetical protein
MAAAYRIFVKAQGIPATRLSDSVVRMESTDVVRLILLAMFVAVLFQGSVIQHLIEAMERFRGGPRPPRHPLPADDGNLLRSRFRSR